MLGDPLFGFEQRDATDHCGSVLPLVGQFPWHVMAVRWLDGDSAEDSFVAALDTALREREADADYSEHEARVEASHDLEPEPAFQVDESLFYDSDDEEADGTMKSSLAPASVEHISWRNNFWQLCIHRHETSLFDCLYICLAAHRNY